MTTILVVDDSAVDRRIVGGLLKKEGGWRIEFAENASEALARMKDAVPDLVITDLQMPTMDGLELVAAARVHYPDVPVILITAYGSEMLAVEALEQGATTYVPKSGSSEIRVPEDQIAQVPVPLLCCPLDVTASAVWTSANQ